MTEFKTPSARKFLEAKGFVPTTASRQSQAGTHRDWQHADGRKAQVAWRLVGRSGQRAGCTGWGYVVTIN